MIKQGLKNFFKNLKYFFTPLGVMALGAIIGFSILLPGLMSSLEKLAKEVQKILADVDIDFPKLKDQLVVSIKALDWGNPLASVRTMFSNEWITNTLNSCIGGLVGDSGVYVAAISGAVDTFSLELIGYIVGFFIFVGLGIVAGFIFTKYLIRREIAKRSSLKFILVSIFGGVFSLIFVICVGWLTSIWKPSLYIAIIAFILIFGISSLIEAYLIQGRGKVDAKDVVNFKNIIGLFAVDIIIIAISVAAAFIVGKVLNNLVELFVGLALFEIAIIVMDLNAESYVKSLSKQVEGTSLPEPESKTRKKRNDKKIESES